MPVPALETMESLLFQLILAGFVLLTVTVLSGTVFSEQVFGQPFVLSHHVVLSVLAWLTFAVLLAGRRLFGWRGRSAIRWTLTGFVLLALAYFGTRFVLEVVRHEGRGEPLFEISRCVSVGWITGEREVEEIWDENK